MDWFFVQERFRCNLRSRNFTYLINASVAIVYWLVFHPGLFSSDSFAAYEIAKSGNLNNAFTAAWAIFVRYFSLFGHVISLLTLINVLLLSYALTKFCVTLFDQKVARRTSFLMCLTPGVSGIGITLWHDIPMTSGFLLVLSCLVRLQDANPFRGIVLFDLILGSILISFRPNGLPTLVVIFIFTLIVRRLRNSARPIAISFFLAGVATLFSSYIAIGEPPINRMFAQEWMRNDISCFAAKVDKHSFENITKIPKELYEDWKSRDACVFLNRFSLSDSEKQNSLSYVPKSWLRLGKSEPFFVMDTHLKRNAYLIPLPVYGIPMTPFLHTNIEFENRGIEWTFDAVAQNSRILLRSWNYLRPITGWVGFWLLVIIAFALKENDVASKLVFTFSIALVSILFVFAPIPDGRYGLFVLISGQVLVTAKAVMYFEKRRRE